MFRQLRSIVAAGLAGTASLLLALQPGPAAAQANMVRVVVPYAAGSSTDITARQFCDALHRVNGRQYIIDNKPGAGGTIGSNDVAKSKPDGSVLLMTTGGHVTNPAFYARLPYDTVKDFTAITTVSVSTGFVLLVPARSPYTSLDQLIAAARARPGSISYGSAGVGNTTHLVGALFEKNVGLSLLHVPYKGSPINDLIAGQIDMVFWGSSAAAQFVHAGQLKALAITGDKRYDELPTVPTLVEKGIQEVDAPAWAGLFGPAGMPKDMVDQLYRDAMAAAKDSTYIAASKAVDRQITLTEPAKFQAQVAADVERYKRILPKLNIKMD